MQPLSSGWNRNRWRQNMPEDNSDWNFQHLCLCCVVSCYIGILCTSVCKTMLALPILSRMRQNWLCELNTVRYPTIHFTSASDNTEYWETPLALMTIFHSSKTLKRGFVSCHICYNLCYYSLQVHLQTPYASISDFIMLVFKHSGNNFISLSS